MSDDRTGDAGALGKAYDPTEVEQRWYAFWEREGVFEADDQPDDGHPAYVIPMPPPNVTGSLHMGHALTATLEDVLVRWHRMRGFNTLWQPGIDHAGIATQTVVERQLAREGTTRHELGREAFIERVWKWKAESGGRIAQQQRELGASPDWPRLKFTMDPDLSHAVQEAFVRLYEEGLIYRDTRLINWCPDCRTALSDLEVENEEGANGELFEFAYKVEGSDEEIVVATTRPETMLGDTAVAVHPDDPRYTHLHGKHLVHPFVDRKIPIVTDGVLVDPEFGTGAVKVTPAHDFNDFATGKRHGLDEINILNLDGTMNDAAGEFAGLERKRARTAVKKALDEKGLARGTKPHTLTLPRCQRSNTIVEPMISTQWFCKMQQMAESAMKAVHDGRTQIIPEEWTKTYDHFLSNIQDWCISRQLWWGHQIPAWHGPNGEIRVAREQPEECSEGAGWKRDPDVLDTWFSSALWPFSTLGWPEKTAALETFYPASDLETGYDILFFWVARMMMFGLHFMGDVPFRRVLLHGMVVDETGDKMSKVKGNVIDPLDLIHGATFKEVVHKALPGAPEKEALAKFKKAYPSTAQMGSGFPAFGADALRFTLSTFPPSNKRIALAPKRIEGYRHFLNKIWNASRFALTHLEGFERSPDPVAKPKHFYNRWILSRLGHVARTVHDGISAFRIDEAAQALYRFFWYDFCDWYLELTKPIFQNADADRDATQETREVLAEVLDQSLRLMHPMIPYVTEELWQKLPKRQGEPTTIALARYPEPDALPTNEAVDREMETVQSVIVAARTMRSEHEIRPASAVRLVLRSDDPTTRETLERHRIAVESLVRTDGPMTLESTQSKRPPGTTMAVVPSTNGPIEVLIDLRGHVTADKERARIDRERKRIDRDLGALDKKLSSPGFVDRAPKEVVDETRAQRAALAEARERLNEAEKLAGELGDA